jgi:hypothetical protein
MRRSFPCESGFPRFTVLRPSKRAAQTRILCRFFSKFSPNARLFCVADARSFSEAGATQRGMRLPLKTVVNAMDFRGTSVSLESANRALA